MARKLIRIVGKDGVDIEDVQVLPHFFTNTRIRARRCGPERVRGDGKVKAMSALDYRGIIFDESLGRPDSHRELRNLLQTGSGVGPNFPATRPKLVLIGMYRARDAIL